MEGTLKQRGVLANLVDVRVEEPKSASEKICSECGGKHCYATGKDFESSKATGGRRVYEVKCDECGYAWFE